MSIYTRKNIVFPFPVKYHLSAMSMLSSDLSSTLAVLVNNHKMSRIRSWMLAEMKSIPCVEQEILLIHCARSLVLKVHSIFPHIPFTAVISIFFISGLSMKYWQQRSKTILLQYLWLRQELSMKSKVNLSCSSNYYCALYIQLEY